MENNGATTNGNGERNGERNGEMKASKPRPILNRAWSDLCDDVEIPGTPKTPRTSTTPG